MARGLPGLIPAHGGTGRMPREAGRPLYRRPAIACSIATALGRGRFVRAVVTTDGEADRAVGLERRVEVAGGGVATRRRGALVAAVHHARAYRLGDSVQRGVDAETKDDRRIAEMLLRRRQGAPDGAPV